METSDQTNWTDEKTHNEMLEEIEKQRSLIAMTEKRKKKIIFGHIIRRNNFIRNILGKNILVKKGR